MGPDRQALARDIVQRFGWNTTCFQILNPGIARWFDASESSVVGYIKTKGIRVVAGAPVTDPDSLERIVTEWESSDENSPCCYFGAEERLYEFIRRRPGYSTVVIGAQPRWSPDSWLDKVATSSSLRAQLSRAKAKSVTVSEWPPKRVKDNPELRRCLDHWLGTRGLPPMHFLVEPEILSAPDGRRVFVAERAGTVIGFVALAPIPARNAWLTEMFVRGKGAPNGTVELALTHAVAAVAQSRAEFVTMGMVPLSRHVDLHWEGNPRWLRGVGSWSRAHLKRFYNFDGLDFFKSKFLPDSWEPIYVIANRPEFTPRFMLAVVGAFTNGHPFWAFLRGVWKAAQQECRWSIRSGLGLWRRTTGQVGVACATNPPTAP